jgi:putative ABC transport system permease protein
MFFRMFRGAFTRQKGKFFMIAFTVALGVSLATAMLNVMMDVGDKVNQELKTYGANIVVTPRGASLLGDLYGVEEGRGVSDKYLAEEELGKMKTIFWAYNIVDFAPLLEMPAVLGEGRVDATLVGTWFDKHFNLPTTESVDTGLKRLKSWWDVRGAWPLDEIPNQAMVGEALARKLGIEVGAALPIVAGDGKRTSELTVSAIFHSGGSEDDRIYVPLAMAQELSGRPGLVQSVEVSALTTPENDLARRAAQDPGSLSRKEWDAWYCTAYVSSIAYQIEEVLTDARAKPVLQVTESEGIILQKTQLLMLLITGLSLICAALAISNLVTANVMEQSAEIGLLKAIGAAGGSISLLILAEILATSVTGGIIGYFVGLGFAQIIGHTVFGSGVAVKTVVIPLISVMVFLVAVIGSLPAIRVLLSLRPTEVLHGR